MDTNLDSISLIFFFLIPKLDLFIISKTKVDGGISSVLLASGTKTEHLLHPVNDNVHQEGGGNFISLNVNITINYSFLLERKKKDHIFSIGTGIHVLMYCLFCSS